MKTKTFVLTLKLNRSNNPIRCKTTISDNFHYGLIVHEFESSGNISLDQALKLGKEQCFGEFPHELSDVACGVIITIWLIKAAQNYGHHINLSKIESV